MKESGLGIRKCWQELNGLYNPNKSDQQNGFEPPDPSEQLYTVLTAGGKIYDEVQLTRSIGLRAKAIWVKPNGNLIENYRIIAWKESPDCHDEEEVPFTVLYPKEVEFHEMICLGAPSITEIASAMRVSHSRISRIASLTKSKNPILEVNFHSTRIEVAMDLYRSGMTWDQVASELGYKSRHSVRSSVRGYLGVANFRSLWE